MIDPKELRIGNIVEVDGKLERVLSLPLKRMPTIGAHSGKRYEGNLITTDNHVALEPSRVNPVAFTEALLLDYHFRRIGKWVGTECGARISIQFYDGNPT